MYQSTLSGEERFRQRFKESKETIARLRQSPIKYIYTFRTMRDLAVCNCCKSLQGKTFNIEDAEIGVNYPPLKDCTCDFCRCRASHDIMLD